MLRLEVVALYAGVNILVLLVLAYLVIRGRQTHKIVLGDAGNDPMNRAVRAHGNAAEYIPAGLVGLLILALFNNLPIWVIHAGGLSLTLGRVFHAVGLHTGKINFGRFAGAALSLLALLIIGASLLYVGLTHQLGG